MPEYAGYVKKPTPIDWGEVAGGIVTQMKDVEKEHAAFREKHDKMVFDMNKQFSEYESTKAPALDEVLFQLTTDGKDLLNKTHTRLKYKDIEPSYMGMTKQSMSDATTELHNITSNIGTVLAEAQAQVDEGDANPVMQQWAIDQYKTKTNLKKQKPVWVQDQNNGYTSLVLQKVDGEGELIPGPGTTTSIKTLGNINNLRFLPIDLDADMKKFKLSYKEVKDATGTYLPITDEDVESYIKNYTSNPNNVLGLLTMVGDDKGTYTPYAEGDTPTDPTRSIEITVDDDYEYEPNFTEDHLKVAEDILRSRLERLRGKKKPTPGGGGGGGSTSDQPKLVYEYSTGLSQGSQAYIDLLINDPDNGIVDVEVTQSGPRKGVTIIKDDGQRIFTKFQYDGSNIDHDATGKNLAKYFSKKTDITDQQSEYDEGRTDYGKVSAGGTTTKKVKPNITTVSIEYDHPYTPGKVQGIQALADLTDTHATKFFKDIGIPGVKVSKYKHGDDTFEIKVNGKTFTIHKTKRKTTGNNSPVKGGAATMSTVKEDVQKVIDWYWNELGMQEPGGEQQIDVTEIGSKYNVA